MKDASKHMDSIVRRIRKDGCVLMLDFDGTLSPIVSNHRTAQISESTRESLRNAARHFPVAIISGRALSDVRNKIRLPISYAGSHGLESHIFGTSSKTQVKIPGEARNAFLHARRALGKIARDYRGVRVESKRLGYAIHYRSLSSVKARLFLKEALIAIGTYIRPTGIRVINDLYTFDIMPDLKRTKAHCALELFLALRKSRSSIPVYIGDSSTDEDAFRSLADGITIRVGKNSASVAQFYFQSRSGVDRFLRKIANI
ncbi:MAG: Alpha,alpha-trehalose-phosphate synthase [UDP-forming] / trehalose 6-phosphate phosphatase [Candidatus Kaiserbacteria bacterium GW2011_GWA2_49_19]|uniref:Trehalose 6-phosphate phosphatase n=1 Tax=Candidatus Kaiserbacteria bacterium GW2011_GWA2_49_19 TaxID=1618669 RepID=A0A0G1VQN1_9BACT|nr:MAG: Alpha,alpha-trehalose-phosphate synthase [UDP-forming] / trehalose 6-phosphate phosphatase [Candidatus Kaiserbacteria bacterium GW2011_GWA2_49_19]